jgi:hypothetical protein
MTSPSATRVLELELAEELPDIPGELPSGKLPRMDG